MKASAAKREGLEGAAARGPSRKTNTAAVAVIKANADAFALELEPVVRAIQAEGITSLNGIARRLNEIDARTARGGKWQAITVRNLLARLP